MWKYLWIIYLIKNLHPGCLKNSQNSIRRNPKNKCAEDLNSYFTKEDTQIANKKCSDMGFGPWKGKNPAPSAGCWLLLSQLVKRIIRYYYISFRMAKIQKRTTPSPSKEEGQLEPSHKLLMGLRKCFSHSEKVSHFLIQLNTCFQYNPVIAFFF